MTSVCVYEWAFVTFRGERPNVARNGAPSSTEHGEVSPYARRHGLLLAVRRQQTRYSLALRGFLCSARGGMAMTVLHRNTALYSLCWQEKLSGDIAIVVSKRESIKTVSFNAWHLFAKL